MVRTIIAIECLAIAVPVVLIFGILGFIAWGGHCPQGNRCAADRFLLWVCAVIVLVSASACVAASRYLWRSWRLKS